MTITYRNGVEIAEIVVYSPLLLVAVYLIFRHRGLSRKSAWFYVLLFIIIRFVSACFGLATISQPTTAWLYTAYSITSGVAISPLELALLNLEEVIISEIHNRGGRFPLPSMFLRLLHLLVIAALALGIVGGVDASNTLEETGVYVPQTLSKVSTALFLVAYAAIVLVAVVSYMSVSLLPPDGRKFLYALLLSLPFLLVRLVYSAISTFANSSNFNLITGNVTIWLIMAIIMEMIIIVILEFTGLSTRPLPKSQQPDVPLAYSTVGDGEGRGHY